jgi:Predicted membrane protein
MPSIYTRFLFILTGLATLTPWISTPVALISGCLFVQFLGNPFPGRSASAGSFLLKCSVVGLGFGMQIESALRVSKDGFWLTLASICLIFALSVVVGRWLGIPRRLTHLVASGTAICGGSAIAAVGPAVRASSQEMSLALGVVFLLNALALVLFPPLGHLLGMDEYQFGLWTAIAIHDTSSVVGAASAYGPEALQVATTVKLARALWIIPLTLISALLFKSREGKARVPVFILGFVAAMLFNSWVPLPVWLTGGIVQASRSVLSLCLFLMGTSLSLESVRRVGWQPLALGFALWCACSFFSLFAIVHC